MEVASPPSFPRKLVFRKNEDTHQVAQENGSTVFCYVVVLGMVVSVAVGAVAHGFLYKNGNDMTEYIIDKNT